MALKKLENSITNIAGEIGKTAVNVSSKVKEGANKSTEIVNKVMDVNGDGQVDIEDVIIMGLKVPGICIKREEFLRGEFMKDFPQETIDDAIEFNPAPATPYITPKQRVKIFSVSVSNFFPFSVTSISGNPYKYNNFCVTLNI